MTIDECYDMIDLALEYERLSDALIAKSIHNRDLTTRERVSQIEQIFMDKYKITHIVDFLKGYKATSRIRAPFQRGSAW